MFEETQQAAQGFKAMVIPMSEVAGEDDPI